MDEWDRRIYRLFTDGEAEFTDVAQYLDRICRDYGSSNSWAKSKGLGQRTVQEIIRGAHIPSDRTLSVLGLRRIITDDKKVRFGYAVERSALPPQSSSVIKAN